MGPVKKHHLAPFLLLLALGSGPGCSTPKTKAPAVVVQPVPLNLQSPHPRTLESADLRALLKNPDAPEASRLDACDADFVELKERAQNSHEFSEGVRELVVSDPIKYHWCFYFKVLKLNDALQASTEIEQRQSNILRVYLFLAPVARAFFSEFSDPRYLRRAIFKYRSLSETAFYRRVELSPS